MWICILGAALAATAQAGTPDYAYAWPLVTDGAGAAFQVELTPDVYAALTSNDLRDLDIVNADGDSVPTAPFRPSAVTRSSEHSFAPPAFVLPAENSGASDAEDEIHLHIERAADGKLRSLDATVTPLSPPMTATGGARLPSNATPDSPPRTADGTSTILIDASHAHEPISALIVDWDTRTDTIAHFSISASDDLQTWRTLVASAAVIRLTQDGNALEKHEIPLDHAVHPYLTVTHIESDIALPALIVRVRTQAQPTLQKPVEQWMDATADGSDTADATSTGMSAVYRYHVPAPLPVGSIQLTLADDNSVARGTVSHRVTATPPNAWLRGPDVVAFRLRDGDTILHNDSIRLPTPQRSNDWRVAFASPIAHAPALSLAYTPDRFVFLAQGTGPYRLVAGSANTRRADAPVDVALSRLRASGGSAWAPPLASLGGRVDVRGTAALSVAKPATPSPWKTWLLWGVLVAAAGIVASLALSLLRKN